jgi:hypothetical protein
MSARNDSRTRRRALPMILALLPMLFALGCEEGARAGSVYRVRAPYGPWWVHPSVYDRQLALGRPKVTTPPAAEPAPAEAFDDGRDAGDAE